MNCWPQPEWVDKWTMYFGDLYQNTASNTQVTIHPEGRNAFYKYLHDSLAANKPYNQMATEIIAAQGTNSFDQTNGQINYYPLGIVTGGPAQDIFDSQTANVADQFLGLAHVNCLLCHNGAGHLTALVSGAARPRVCRPGGSRPSWRTPGRSRSPTPEESRLRAARPTTTTRSTNTRPIMR